MKIFLPDLKSTVIVLVCWFLLLQPNKTLGDGCKTMIFLLEQDGYSLRNHTIQNFTDVKQDFCQITCYMDDSCMSYNYRERSGTCEINNSDQYNHPDDLVNETGTVYVGTENTCNSKPCPSNIVCQPNFYNKNYSCLCPTGFSGSNCSDIDECEVGSHDCSVNRTCINTVGSYNCTCKPGYQGDGITCSDIDECATNIHNCSVNSVCMNTQGSFECECYPGYKEFEKNCIEILSDYEITVYTNNAIGSGTDAKVFIKIYGTQFNKVSTSTKRQLRGTFEKNDVDKTTLNGIPNMESLSKITMSHDNTGWLSDWYLKKVIVDNKTRRTKYTFLCRCWLRATTSLSKDIWPTKDIRGRPLVTRY